MPDAVPPDWVLMLPSINASLNATAAVLLIVGYLFIRWRQVQTHRNIMLTAFVVSAVFLVCYLTYHQALYAYTGTHGKAFTGTGSLRLIYFVILITHVVLAAAVGVLAPLTIWLGLSGKWDRHRQLARVTFPIWVYVSVTGVIIYWMLYQMG